jgi:hypothetical protein
MLVCKETYKSSHTQLEAKTQREGSGLLFAKYHGTDESTKEQYNVFCTSAKLEIFPENSSSLFNKQ